ncbi:hypothetical protein [Streptomyces purpurascens]
MRRWFDYRGYDVTLVDVTDIDDKIIASRPTRTAPGGPSVTRTSARSTTAAPRPRLPPPRPAACHRPHSEMVEMMRGLIERGPTYEADGNVYFDVRSFPGYLELSNQELDNLQQPSGAGETGKRDPRELGRVEGGEAGRGWETPWGRGRRGWHLECSAMARGSSAAPSRHPRRRPRPGLPAPRTRSPRPTATRSRGTGCTTPGSR